MGRESIDELLTRLNDFDDDVFSAYGRAMAQAQHFEYSLAARAIVRRTFADAKVVANPDVWLRRLHSGDDQELKGYAMKLIRMTAGRRTRELNLPPRVVEDVAALVTARDHLAHAWFREHHALPKPRGAIRSWIAELEALERRFERSGFALVTMALRRPSGDGRAERDDERVWARYAHVGEGLED